MFSKLLLFAFVVLISYGVHSESEVSGSYDQVSEFNFIFKGMIPDEACCGDNDFASSDDGGCETSTAPVCSVSVGAEGDCEHFSFSNAADNKALLTVSGAEGMVAEAPFNFMAPTYFHGSIEQENDADNVNHLGATQFLSSANIPEAYVQDMTLDNLVCTSGPYNLCDSMELLDSLTRRMDSHETRQKREALAVNEDYDNKFFNVEEPHYLNTHGGYFQDTTETGKGYCPVWTGSRTGGKVCEGQKQASARRELDLPNGASILEVVCHFSASPASSVSWSLLESPLAELPSVLPLLSFSADAAQSPSAVLKKSADFSRSPIVVNTALNTYELEVKMEGDVSFYRCSINYQ